MNDEVSKLGQSDEDEPIEGKIVPDYAGPGFNAWDYIDATVRDMYRQGSYHFIVDEDGVHDGDAIMAPGGWCVPKEQHYDTGNTYRTGRMYVAPVDDPTDWTEVGSAGVTFERGPSFTEGWWDEVAGFDPGALRKATVTTTFEDVSNETFRLLSGYDKNVLIAANKLGTKPPVPPVDPAHVRWPKEEPDG